MNLLPREKVEFARGDYWDRFFRERGSKKFEWYGEYLDLCGELHKYIKPSDVILVVGCGSSNVSSHLYDAGYKSIANIDISDVVIRQMKNKFEKSKPEMTFQKMDALNMSFHDESFSVVLDKGTLDALIPTDAKEDIERGQKLFSEVERVLKLGGRYIIISLLQPHILKTIVKHFSEIGWLTRVIRCQEVEKKNIEETGHPGMPVFMVVCTKLKKMGNRKGILETNVYVNDIVRRIESEEVVYAMVEGVQNALMHLKNSDGEVEVEFRREGENRNRYLIYIVDMTSDQRLLKKYGAFIVPKGRDKEWMFGCKDGRKFLAKDSKCDRLAVIVLRRDQHYEGLQEVQDELTRTVLQFSPSYMENSGCSGIPYMTEQEIGKSETIHTAVSELSGEMIVNDVDINGNVSRRLIFASNMAAIQSEVKLVREPSKKKKKSKWVVNAAFPANPPVPYLAVGVRIPREAKSVLVLGLGGGGLSLFLSHHYPALKIVGVEIDPVVVDIAKEFFGLEACKNVKVVVADAADYILNDKDKYDAVVLDIDSKIQGSGVSAPPPQFLLPSVLEVFKNMVGGNGVFIANIVSRVEAILADIMNKFRKHFSRIAWYDLKEDVNRIVFMSNREDASDEDWRKVVLDAATDLNESIKKKTESEAELDMAHFAEKLT